MRRDRWVAVGRAAGWTGTGLPAVLLGALVLGSVWLAVACWVLVLTAQSGLAWTQVAGYPPLGPWAALVSRHPGVTRRALHGALRFVRRVVPGDGLGFLAALSGPLVVCGVLTMATWLPWAWRAVLVGGTAVHLYGALTRTGDPAAVSTTETTRPDEMAGRWTP